MVRMLRNSRPATSALVSPAATRLNTSVSRGLSPQGYGTVAGWVSESGCKA